MLNRLTAGYLNGVVEFRGLSLLVQFSVLMGNSLTLNPSPLERDFLNSLSFLLAKERVVKRNKDRVSYHRPTDQPKSGYNIITFIIFREQISKATPGNYYTYCLK